MRSPFSFSQIILFVIILSICIPCFFIPFFSDVSISPIPTVSPNQSISSSEFCWPAPGYTKITSPFGYRSSPVTGAKGDFHSGIDVAAPAGSSLVAIIDGRITLAGFSGANGYAIVIQNEPYKVTYCHMAPSFLVHLNDTVSKGQAIGYVGPKNVYGIANNPYKDHLGNPTNGSTTGPHLHITIRKDGTAVDPLSLF